MKKMKALVKSRPEKGLWMEEVPVPEPGLNDVIIKVKNQQSVEQICIFMNGTNGRRKQLRHQW
jgi:hypothetical protein